MKDSSAQHTGQRLGLEELELAPEQSDSKRALAQWIFDGRLTAVTEYFVLQNTVGCITAAGRGKCGIASGGRCGAHAEQASHWRTAVATSPSCSSSGAQASCSNRKVAVGGCVFHCCAVAAAAAVGGGL